MARISVPTDFNNNESFGGSENLTNALAAVETALNEGMLTVVDTSVYFTPDGSTTILSWKATVV